MFEDAVRYKLVSKDGDTRFFDRDAFVLHLYQWNLSYRYTAVSLRRGVLELYNDVVDLVFKVILYSQ